MVTVLAVNLLLSRSRRLSELTILVEGNRRLFNQYGVILVNPARHRHVKRADGQAFIDWLASRKGKAAIAACTINSEQPFFPNAAGAGRSS